MVEPTKRKPRSFRSLLIASDSGVRAGTCFMPRRKFCCGRPFTKPHRYASNEPNFRRTSRNARALPIADSILRRLRTIPAAALNLLASRAPERGALAGSERAKALRVLFGLFRVVEQDSDACGP